MIEDNKKFIDMIETCKGTNLSKERLDILKRTDVNIRDLYKKMDRYCSREGMDEPLEVSNYILNSLCDIVASYNVMTNKEKFIDTYNDILDMQIKYRVHRYAYLMTLSFFGHYKNYLLLHRDLWMLRVIDIYQKGDTLLLDGKIVNISYELYVGESGDKYIVLSLNNSTDDSIGGIFIKNGEIEYKKVSNEKEQIELVLSMIKDDYDLVITPNMKLLDFDIKTKISEMGLNNKAYLKFLALTENTLIGGAEYKAYWNVWDSNIDMTSILSIARYNNTFIEDLLKFTSLMIDKFKKEPDKIVELERIKKALDEKVRILSESEFINYMRFTNNMIEKMNVDRTIKRLEAAL